MPVPAAQGPILPEPAASFLWSFTNYRDAAGWFVSNKRPTSYVISTLLACRLLKILLSGIHLSVPEFCRSTMRLHVKGFVIMAIIMMKTQI